MIRTEHLTKHYDSLAAVEDVSFQVQPGEVLVCGGTTTEWTPAFGFIAACVCDTGGSLTHAAIVSREYGIPGVVGTRDATTLIHDGALVRVEGATGTVEILG